ncbi:MAG: hypothetical protein NTW83_11710 [Cyanobacteria bacterium]|nr:hypothetical protein [Cyanobacteriota bacterium]
MELSSQLAAIKLRSLITTASPSGLAREVYGALLRRWDCVAHWRKKIVTLTDYQELLMTEFGISLLIATAKALLGSALVLVSVRLTGRWLMRLTRRTPGDTDDQLLRSVLTTAAPIGYLSAFWWG